jgi:ABC-type lipoprotein export system ATPase subunit
VAASDGDIVVAERLCASYGEGPLKVTVLEGAAFAVARGSVTAIVGPSGSGKTTLLSLVGGLDTPESGSLRVEGVDLAGLSRKALGRYRRGRVGFVFQFFNLLPGLTAVENVEAGLAPLRLGRKERRHRAGEALGAVGLGDKLHRLPHELSGGEQQRVAVARACAKEPPLLLADEPTGSLDEESGALVLDLLLAARGETTVVLVTHDAEVARRADCVLHLRGRRVTRG